jgi:hypothetical protein
MKSIFIFMLVFVYASALKNVIRGSFRPADKHNFQINVRKVGSQENLCTVKYEQDEVKTFSTNEPCEGPYLLRYGFGHFKALVGIRNPEDAKYAMYIDNGISPHENVQDMEDTHVHAHKHPDTPHVHHGTNHGTSHGTSHPITSWGTIPALFGEPGLHFLSRRSHPLKGHELRLKRRHVLKEHHLADFDWEKLGGEGCQFVGPHSNCTGCKDPAIEYDGPSSEHHLCVLDGDDMATWTREDFLEIYEVRREQFVDAYTLYMDQLDHYHTVKAAYDVAREAIKNQTAYVKEQYQEVVDLYHDKAHEVYNKTMQEFELLKQLQFAMNTAREIYTAACQAFITNLYERTGATVPVINHAHLHSVKPVLMGINEILTGGGWTSRTFMLMKSIDSQIKHLLK